MLYTVGFVLQSEAPAAEVQDKQEEVPAAAALEGVAEGDGVTVTEGVTEGAATVADEEIDIDLTDPEVEAAATKIQAGFKGA